MKLGNNEKICSRFSHKVHHKIEFYGLRSSHRSSASVGVKPDTENSNSPHSVARSLIVSFADITHSNARGLSGIKFLPDKEKIKKGRVYSGAQTIKISKYVTTGL